jgi:transposase InsO family protein
MRRACSVLRAERSSYHYRGKGADQADLKQRIKEIAETRVRYGYRRIHMLLQCEGWAINGKRVYRLYRAMGLQLRKKAPKRRVKAKLREGCCAASRVNDVWAMDFVHDQLATGLKLRILTVVDTFSRFSPAVVPRFRFRAPDVVEVLERVASLRSRRRSGARWAQIPDPVDHRRGEPGMSGAAVARKLRSDDMFAALTELFITRGPPAHIRSDNGPELSPPRCKNGSPRSA